jgi:hypothetical protein
MQRLNTLPSMIFANSSGSINIEESRMGLFERLCKYLPENMRPPTQSINDFV